MSQRLKSSAALQLSHLQDKDAANFLGRKAVQTPNPAQKGQEGYRCVRQLMAGEITSKEESCIWHHVPPSVLSVDNVMWTQINRCICI